MTLPVVHCVDLTPEGPSGLPHEKSLTQTSDSTPSQFSDSVTLSEGVKQKIFDLALEQSVSTHNLVVFLA